MDNTEGIEENKFLALVNRMPLVWLALALLAGILFASLVTLPWQAWSILVGCALLLAAASRLLLPRSMPSLLGRPPKFWMLLFFLAAAFLLGAARYQLSIPKVDAHQVAWFNDREADVLITGWVAAPPDVRDSYTNLRVQTTAVDTGDGDLPVKGLVLVRLGENKAYRYGEVIRLRGHLSTPPEWDDFSYRDYLARQGIHAYMSSAKVTRLPFAREGSFFLRPVFDLKDKALATVYKIFPDPEASLLAGILLGVDTGMAPDVQQAFRDTGTSHIIAISGFNITILAGLFMKFSRRLFRGRLYFLAAVAGIVLYTLLVGAEPSVVRAAIMGGLGILAGQLGRRQTALNSLAFAAVVMCLINPFMPWDVSFQLSFFATLGLVLYAQPFEAWALKLISRFTLPARAEKVAGYISTYVLFTLAAQLTTLPIMAWHFGRLPLISLITNVLILPVQPAVMVLGGLALLGGLLYIPLGSLLAWIAWPFATYTIRVVELFSRLPHGVIVLGEFSFLFVIGYYLVLFLFTFSRGKMKKLLRTATNPTILLSGLLILAVLTWRAALSSPDGRLHITFLDVGTAEAVLIETPSGRYILVNGGPSPTALSDSLGRLLPPFNRSLDWLIVASPQEEQMAALPRVLARFPPREALWLGNLEASYSALQVDEWLTGNEVPIISGESGYALDLGYGARLEVAGTTPRGGVLLIKWGNFSALLPIGLNFEALEELEYGRAVGAVDVLLLADSGYAPLNPSSWIENLQPQLIILSVAAGDPSGLPDASVLDSCSGRTLLRTDQDGWIEVSTDGEVFEVTAEKKK